MTVPYRWKRHHNAGSYTYGCSAELDRSSAVVFKESEGWFFSTKWGGVCGEKEVGARICECCETKFPGQVLGWKTHTEAKRAAEVFIEGE